MPNIPNIDIHSLVMKERHERMPNGTTIIKFLIANDASILQEPLKKIGIDTLPKYFNLNTYCEIADPLELEFEGTFFVKSSSYKNSKELYLAEDLALQDNARFHLYHNKVNPTLCPKLYEYAAHLNMSYSSFYNSFVTEGKTIQELVKANPVLSLAFNNAINSDLDELIQNMNDIYTINEPEQFSTLLVKSFKVFFEQNANILFYPANNYTEANLIMFPSLNNESNAAELKLFSNNKIEQIFLFLHPTHANSSTLAINDFIHGLAHIFLDHICENYYPCNKAKMQTQTSNLQYLSIMSQLSTPSIINASKQVEFQLIQSLLPWDLAALRLAYGMPSQPINTTYSLNSDKALEEIFATKLLNNSLLCFSATGHSTIDTGHVKSYEIDLRFDHLSNVTNQEISFQFLLSYDTKISSIFLYTPGKVILNESVPVNIFIHSTEVNICTSLTTNFTCENNEQELAFIGIGNFNDTIHNIYQQVTI